MKWTNLLILIIGLFLLVVFWQYHQAPQDPVMTLARARAAGASNEPIVPLPASFESDGRKVALGEKLFNDSLLSSDGTVSCASCHSLTEGGTDRLPRSVGVAGRIGSINAPTVFNSGFNSRQFWDGRAGTLEDQIDGPTHNPLELGSNWAQILEKLARSPEYVREFGAIYPDGIQERNVKAAIAAFERTLVTPNSRFDRYLNGEGDALTEEEKEGYRLFKIDGCVSCHQGINVGGNLFQKFGVMGDYFADRGRVTKADLGRFNVTGEEADRYVFKVPSLRNVELTAPYLHDGSAERLEDAVTIMSVYQLGRPLTVPERDAIVKFLKTLTGEYKGRAL
jgi:cytochrome c peroxidase